MTQTTRTTNGQGPVKIAPVSAKKLPHDPFPDSTLLLLRDGYRFVSKRCDELKTDVFRTRLMMRDVVCMRGEAAARLFYDETRIRRRGSLPVRLQRTLLGEGGVHGLDGEEHRVRKAMHQRVLSDEPAGDLVDRFVSLWRGRLGDWEDAGKVVLLDESALLLTQAVCDWAGFDLQDKEVEALCADVLRVLEGAGAVGPKHWAARRARVRLDRWMQKRVEAVRLEGPVGDDGRALMVFTWHQDADGTLPEKNVAAVELLNLVIGVVAVAYYVALSGVTLDAHPEWRRRLEQGDESEQDRFVAELRRLYPLVPFVIGRAREDFGFNGFLFEKDQRVLLDLYGTNRHPDSWGAADKFHPDRFTAHEEHALDRIPHGGGDKTTGHRCPGEDLTGRLVKSALRVLTRQMRYEVPPQDLKVDPSCVPLRPGSGFVMQEIRPAS